MDIASLYRNMGIRGEVLEFCLGIEAELRERFAEIDRTAEFNQLKVIGAMQENRVNKLCHTLYPHFPLLSQAFLSQSAEVSFPYPPAQKILSLPAGLPP